MATYNARRIVWATVILFSLVALNGLLLTPSSTIAQSKCGPAASCPTPTSHSSGGPNLPGDGRLNTNTADPFVVYCVTGQFQIYRIDSFSHGQLLSTHPLNQVISLSQTSALTPLGR